MADYTLAIEDIGIYEIPLAAGDTVTIEIESRSSIRAFELQVTAHTGNSPLYAKLGNTIAPRDTDAQMFPAGSFGTIYGNTTETGTVAFTSASNATFSVARA